MWGIKKQRETLFFNTTRRQSELRGLGPETSSIF